MHFDMSLTKPAMVLTGGKTVVVRSPSLLGGGNEGRRSAVLILRFPLISLTGGSFASAGTVGSSPQAKHSVTSN